MKSNDNMILFRSQDCILLSVFLSYCGVNKDPLNLFPYILKALRCTRKITKKQLFEKKAFVVNGLLQPLKKIEDLISNFCF